MTDIIYIEGKPIPRVDDSEQYFLNRLTILFGPSGSGKSSLIMHIINSIRKDVPVGIVCCPTNSTSGDYDNIFPAEYIHDDINANLMRNIFNRQTDVLAMYNLTRNAEKLRPMFNLIADNYSIGQIARLDKILHEAIEAIKNNCEQDEIETRIQDMIKKHEGKTVKIMRAAILKNKKALSRMELSSLECSILNNMELNPNMLLIIDDCAASIKSWRDLEETKQLFFQGRHFKVTTILTMQNEAIIPPPLRTNAHISIFTNQMITNTYFQKASSGVSPDERKRISKIASIIFAPSDDHGKPNYKKLVAFSNIINTEDKIQYIIANPKRKKFGIEAFWQLSFDAKRQSPSAINKNSFTRMFGLKREDEML